MSSILASLDMSLDDLIAQKKKSSNPDSRAASRGNGKSRSNKADAGSAGPVRGRQQRKRGGGARNQPYGRSRDGGDSDAMEVEDDGPQSGGKNAGSKKRAVVVKKQQGKGGKKGGSILSRLGGSTKDAGSPGTKILVKNLKFDILEDDVRELFGTVGEVKKAEIVYDRSGRSKGIARVWFARRSDAEKALKQYDGRTLDGQPMQLSLDDDANVRKGLFGTALRNDKDVKFKVSFGGGSGDKDNQQKGRGGRGRGRGRDGQSRGNGPSKSAEDLDNEMDTYMKDS
ncbi:Tho complex subunit 4-like, partial [Globisporangium splendens]